MKPYARNILLKELPERMSKLKNEWTEKGIDQFGKQLVEYTVCLLYTSDAADE